MALIILEVLLVIILTTPIACYIFGFKDEYYKLVSGTPSKLKMVTFVVITLSLGMTIAPAVYIATIVLVYKTKKETENEN